MYLIFDTETTGLPKSYNAPLTDADNWPRVVQLAWQLHDAHGRLLHQQSYLVKPEGFTIPFNATKVHGISTERALQEGHDLLFVLQEFNKDVARAERLVGHNIEFDINIMGAEYLRMQVDSELIHKRAIDTKDTSVDFCAIPGGRGGRFKWPTLTELHVKLFGKAFGDAHDAAYDVDATARCFFGLIHEGVITPLGDVAPADIVYEAPVLPEANFSRPVTAAPQAASSITKEEGMERLKDAPFAHLHTHSQFSILQATCEISSLVAAAKEMGMPAVAMTDHGVMYGAFQFVKQALAAELKPIVGCEMYITEDRTRNKYTKDDPDRRYTQVLLAKHKQGYHNLAKLSSEAFISGYYAGFPRIDRPLLEQHKEGLIATTGGLTSEIPSLILNEGEEQAESAFVRWLELFGEDFYIQLNRHGLEEEDYVNGILLGFARKYEVKYFAANNVYYMDQHGADAHDILLCVRDGEKKSTPIGRGRGFRFGFPNDQFYFKSPQEMKELFYDLPEAIETIAEIVDKIEPYKLTRDVLLPAFDIPAEFVDPKDAEDGGKRGENAYLRHLTYVGAAKRYKELTEEIRERLDFELMIIEKTGYPGYFLIVQDFTTEARKMGVSVGPGRGSAAGSAVAYCIGITNVDPIEYDLLFERFLNPDRVSLPDIDIDFDDEGRARIIDWVVQKYGHRQVSHIITYGTMAAKSSIRDTARVLDLPLSDADRIAKLVPDMKLNKLFKMSEDQLREKLNGDEMEMARQLKALLEEESLDGQVLRTARVLEGSVRNTGIHACGIIITPEDMTGIVPMATAKDADLLVTQFDNSVVESAGLLKMDFLGLKTLTIIKDAIKMVKERYGIEIDPDEIPLDDRKTYELYQRGETNGTFQFESAGMQKYLKELQPDVFADLIAMNALYRPGPLEYIPNFVARKHGREPITYDLPGMEEYLAETYGITVYQEQVMLLSQSMAGFTKGEADMLRKAMGKKIFALLEQLKPKFIDGGSARGHDRDKLEKVWRDWEAFAAYAFNKSHSTCYSVVAFHTGYLKANYPPEYMASVMTHNMNDIKKVTFFMEECSRMKVPVLGPDVNESALKFTVNDKGAIRFGLGAIKGVGEGPVEAIVEERKKGPFTSIWDFVERVNLKAVNKKAMEGLAYAGAFDSFEYHRAQYFHKAEDGMTGIERLLRHGNSVQQQKLSAQTSLFGGGGASGGAPVRPKMPDVEPWGKLVELRFEKDVVGFFISGHPLDIYRLELEYCIPLKDLHFHQQEEIRIGGMLASVAFKESRNGNRFGLVELEDYDHVQRVAFFGEVFNKQQHLLVPGTFVCMTGRMKESFNKPGEWEFSPKTVMPLDEVKRRYCKGIDLSVEVTALDDAMILELVDIANACPGHYNMKLEVYAKQENTYLNMYSRRYKIDLNTELLKRLSMLEGLQYRLS